MREKLFNIYKILLEYYGEPEWWPVKFGGKYNIKKEFEIIAGAVLTQNTNWSNVEKALDNFKDLLAPEKILQISTDELARIIKPAGFFNQKAGYLKNIAEWLRSYNFDVERIKRGDLYKLRDELLAVKGIGEETADDILLYAFDFPTFVVDAYTKRLISRLFDESELGLENYKYGTVKKFFELNLPHDAQIYNKFHALIVINAMEHCRKTPVCAGCPIGEKCLRLAENEV
jgi:endonuclease-3 related protein